MEETRKENKKNKGEGSNMEQTEFQKSAMAAFAGDRAFDFYRPMIDGMAQYNSAIVTGFAAMSAEWLAFMNRRLQSDLSFPSQLARCSNPQDLMQEWASFLRTTAEDYRNEFTRLAEINTNASQRAISALQGGSDRWNGRRLRG